MDDRREPSPAEPDPIPPLPVPPEELAPGAEESPDPYAREFAIEQLTGPEDEDD
jgi:hypothetical protein